MPRHLRWAGLPSTPVLLAQPAKEITWGELHVGARQVFEDAGLEEVSRPTLRRVVMRIDFEPGAPSTATGSTSPRSPSCRLSPVWGCCR